MGCCWLKPSLNPILGPWWRRAHLALSSWVSAAGCTFSILSFLSIASAILKLITKRNPSVTSPVLSGPCSELGTIWPWIKDPNPAESSWVLLKGYIIYSWQHHLHQLLEYRCTGLSWLRHLQTSFPFMLSQPLLAADSPRVSVPFRFPVQIFVSSSRDNGNVALLISGCKQCFRVVTHRPTFICV